MTSRLPVVEDDVPRRAWVEQVMGMPVSFHVRGPSARSGLLVDEVVRRAIAELRRVEEVFSVFRPGSQVSRIRAGLLDVSTADPDVGEVVELCRQARERTDGWFDAVLPDADGVRRFNPTGLVKGWAIERVARALSSDLPDHDVLVNAGGDIAVRCRRTDTPDWVLAIEDPADRSRVLARVPMRTGGMATSGTAARGAHIVDPRTGRAATALRSVTVIGPDLLWADVHATAAFARGEAGVTYLSDLPDHLGFVVFPDGATRTIAPA